MLFAVGLLIANHKTDKLQPLQDSIAVVAYPIQLAAEIPADIVDWIGETFSTHTSLLEENRLLHRENQQLRGQMLRFESLEEENAHLREQLGATLRVGERVTLAELTNVDLSPYRQQVWINKGSNAGVYAGQAVVDAHAVMGQVTEVTPFRATVLLITDTLHSIPVKILRTGLRTLAHGSGRIDRLELPYLPDNADVIVGDLLVTSGLGEHFPADYPVARVTAVDRDPGSGFRTVVATPLARLAQDKEVMLVWQSDPVQMETGIIGNDSEPAAPTESNDG